MPGERLVDPIDAAAFARFERDNREAYECFNEAHPDNYYSDHGLRAAFDEWRSLERRGLAFTLVARGCDGECKHRWVGRGVLIPCGETLDVSAVLAYQTDHRHLGQGVASALLDELMAIARAMGLPSAHALVAQDHAVSKRMLLRRGFACVGETEPVHLRRGMVSCLSFGISL